MPPRENSKAAAGRARKQEQADIKKSAANKKLEEAEDEKWSQGAKGKASKEDKEAKAEAARLRKLENARLAAEEESSLPSKPKNLPSKNKSSAKSAASKIPSFDLGGEPSINASGIDDALDALTLVNAKSDKASLGSKAAEIDTHPERRFKAAFEAYKEAELPQMRKDYPGLRLQQYNDKLHRAFQKSPLNPFNQQTMAYNATKEEKVEAVKAGREAAATRLTSN